MNNLCYLTEESLSHWDSQKKINSFLWKILYKRVSKRLDKSLINIENIKKILFNKYRTLNYSINSPLPMVSIRNEQIWYLDEDNMEYFMPLCISFSNGKIRFDIVLIEGKIDIRNVRNSKEHTPMILVKNFEILELCFNLLLEHIEKENNI